MNGLKDRTFLGSDRLVQDLDLQEGERVGVMVSGGKDSIYMWGVLSELLGTDHVLAMLYYRPGITNEVAVENVKRTRDILGGELYIHTDRESLTRFRKNLSILLENPCPEAVRVLLCAGCRYGITGLLYEEGLRRNIRKFFSGASYLELAPFKEELIKACSPSGDLDEGLESILRRYPELDYDNNLEIIRRDNKYKYKSNETQRCGLNADPRIRLFDFDDYFENDPDRIEETVMQKYGWRKTDRSWHFDCGIEDIKDVFYYGFLGYTEMDYRIASMLRYGLLTEEQAEQKRKGFHEHLKKDSYQKMLDVLRDHGLMRMKPKLDEFFRKSPYLDDPAEVDFWDYAGKRVHLIGVGGASMSGVALILQSFGCTVSGSDLHDGHSLHELRKAGVEVYLGHNASHVKNADLAVYSMAIPQDNPELAFCKENGIALIERSVLLGQLTREYSHVLAVCGTHGKTTVTSMLAQILFEAGANPTIHIGGVLDAIGGSIRLGGREIFLTEACEYRRNFMNLFPTIAVLTNIDTDHLDYYRDIDDISDAFKDFLGKLPPSGWVLGNGDDRRVMDVLRRIACPHLTFGMSESCDFRMADVTEDPKGYVSFEVLHGMESLGHVTMAVPGMFNAFNALAAVAASFRLGADPEMACGILGHFTGARRRFERTGMLNGAELFHDYGHNPTEIRNALSIARKRCDKGRLWAVVQPHTYSRVKTLFEDYLTCTQIADITLITDIFAARETDPGDINSGMLVDAMKSHGVNAKLTPTFEDAAEEIRRGVQSEDLVITLGCGNINLLNDMLL